MDKEISVSLLERNDCTVYNARKITLYGESDE